MNSFEKILEVCKRANVPAYPDFNTNNEDIFCVYNVASEHPNCFGDDAPGAVVVSLQLHLYMPKDMNFFTLKNNISRLIFLRGFTYPEISLNAIEDDVRHIVFEFEDDDEDYIN